MISKVLSVIIIIILKKLFSKKELGNLRPCPKISFVFNHPAEKTESMQGRAASGFLPSTLHRHGFRHAYATQDSLITPGTRLEKGGGMPNMAGTQPSARPSKVLQQSSPSCPDSPPCAML